MLKKEVTSVQSSGNSGSNWLNHPVFGVFGALPPTRNTRNLLELQVVLQKSWSSWNVTVPRTSWTKRCGASAVVCAWDGHWGAVGSGVLRPIIDRLFT